MYEANMDIIRDATVMGVVAVYALEKVFGAKKKKKGNDSCPLGVDKEDVMTKSHHDEVCDLKLGPIRDDLGEIKADIKTLLRHNGGQSDGTP